MQTTSNYEIDVSQLRIRKDQRAIRLVFVSMAMAIKIVTHSPLFQVFCHGDVDKYLHQNCAH